MSVIEPMTTIPGAPDWIPPRLRRMTVEEYERLAVSGIIPSSNRCHLINGYLVEKMTHNPPHAVADERCGRELLRALPAGWDVRGGKPVRLPTQASMPEPDRCVVRGSIDDYAERHPDPGDIALVVEVSDSTLSEDRELAAWVYGPAGIAAYWIVDVNGRRIEAHTDPGPQGYRTTSVFTEEQFIPLVIDGREVGRIAVVDMLAPLRPQTPAADGGA